MYIFTALTSMISIFTITPTPSAAATIVEIPISNSLPPYAVHAQPQSQFDLSMIASDFDYALVDSWDGGRAVAISAECLSNARDIIRNIRTMPVWPEVTPIIRGGLNFSWKNDKNYVFLEIRNDGAAHIYYDLIGGIKWEAVRSSDDAELRSRLSAALAMMSGRLSFSFVEGGTANTLSISIDALSMAA